MTEKKYTGFAALYQLDQTDRPADQLVNQTSPLVNHGQPEPVNQLTSVVNQLTSQEVVNQSAIDETKYPSRKDRKLVGLRLPKQKLDLYRMWCLTNKFDLQDAVEMAMDWLTSQTVVNHDSLVNWLTSPDHDDHDDDLIDDNLSSIKEASSFYEKWTGNKFTEKDKTTFREISHLAPTVIKCGILVSLLRAKNKINSLRYCLGAVQEVAKSGIDNKDEYLDYLLRKLQENKSHRTS